jgi:hypothetical protein
MSRLRPSDATVDKKATVVAAFAASSTQVEARASPQIEEDAEIRSSLGYDTPRQPDASDLRAATSVVIRPTVPTALIVK